MNIRFGNLSVRQFADRVGASFTDDELHLLESYRTDQAMFDDPAKFHIFDDPAVSVVIGDIALAATVDTFKASNARRPFNREVNFYPIATS